MTAKAFVGGRILVGGRFLEGRAVLVEDDRIAAVVDESGLPGNAERIELDGAHLLPGFVDIQVNGGGGVLFNDDPSVAAIRAIAETHARFGTTALLPWRYRS